MYSTLNFHLYSDFDNNVNSRSISDDSYPKPFFQLEGDTLKKYDDHLKISPIKKFVFFLSHKSILFHLLLAKIEIDPYVFQKNIIQQENSLTDKKTLTFHIINKMNNELSNRQIDFIVLLYPDKDQFTTLERKEDFFYNSTLLKNITIVNMFDHYLEQNFSIETYSQYATDSFLHLTPLGNNLTAEIILKIIEEKKGRKFSCRIPRN